VTRINPERAVPPELEEALAGVEGDVDPRLASRTLRRTSVEAYSRSPWRRLFVTTCIAPLCPFTTNSGTSTGQARA
jgi:hypothetical protein